MSGPRYLCFRACVRKVSINPFVDVPKRVSRALADDAQAGRIAVEGLLNTFPFRTTLIPLADGRHRLFVNAGMRKSADVEVGDMVVVAVRTAEPGVPAPPDIAAGLRKVKGAIAAFDALSPSHRRELIRYISDARTPETRRKRIQKTAAHVLGQHTPSSSKLKHRPLWTCPKCGNQFVNKNQFHSCHRYRVDEVFAGKPTEIRKLFDRLRQLVEACGPVKLVAYRDKIAFMERVRFAGATPKRNWLDISVWLRRRVKHPRFRRIETIYPDVHVHSLRVTRLEELDDEVAEWLREAYAVGCQQR